ncbi:DVUA0089 family protein [Roseiflexus sp. AH-315-K22]|nr:DVUA0089 family protein [Roseiflexus sp. AH-315-K22]
MKKVVVTCAALAFASSAMAQVWVESPDAGQDGIAAAQMPTGSGALTQIDGEISALGDVDLFGPFVIVDPVGFLADTRGLAGFDTQLFLFDAAGMGVVHNDDWGGLQSAISGQAGFGAGQYYLAISAFNSDPQDAAAAAIFGFTTFPGPDPQQRMPNAGVGALAQWTASGGSGLYSIALQGVEYVPAPGAMSLLGLGGLVAMRRRR